MKRILVLGMHRSGASALGRAIGLLGASMGEPSNLTKTWDNTLLRKVNDTLLEQAGGAWEAPPMGEDWLEEPAARALVERGERVLGTALPADEVSVWKDPRTSLTLPFWLDILDEEPIIVLVHRHPDEVAASLRTSDAVRPAHAYALWEHYNGAALNAAVGLPTIVLDYGQVMSYPAEAATFVSKALAVWGVELPNDPATTDVELSPQQRHHQAKDRDRVDPVNTTPSQAALFTLLDTVAGAHRSLALPTPVPTPSPLSTEILHMAGAIRALRRERREMKQNERKAKQTAKRADESGGRRGRRAGAAAATDATVAVASTGEPDVPVSEHFGAYATSEAADTEAADTAPEVEVADDTAPAPESPAAEQDVPDSTATAWPDRA